MARAWFGGFGLLLGLLPGCCGQGPRSTEAERAAHRKLVEEARAQLPHQGETWALVGSCEYRPQTAACDEQFEAVNHTPEKRRGDWGHDLGDPVLSRVTTAQAECKQHQGTWSREPCAERDPALAESFLQRGPNLLRRHLLFTEPAVATHERFCAKIKGCTLRRNRLPLGPWTSPPLP
jgi:hypothetical protein